ncbi:MAG: nucleoside hydrolase [Gorillibacterium sp.]|nr:nucleoside hydrolase [Gorillibacterium sp.]
MIKKRIILDADTGIDDALAILYAIYCPIIQLEGIMVGFGNTSMEQAADNTLRLLALAKPKQEIPVILGATKPLVRPRGEYTVHVHGENGIGNIELPTTSQQPTTEAAAEFIVRMANENPGELTVVTMGRLTNMAHALELDPNLTTKLKRVVVMGGAVHVPGNVTPVAEANLWGDPEAADLVFTSGVPVTLVGLDVTLKTRITQQQLDILTRVVRPEHKQVAEFMQSAMRHYFNFYRQTNYFLDAAPLHDPLALMVAVHPELVTYQKMKVRVECESSLCAGMVVADLRPIPKVGSEIEVCIDVHAEHAVGQFLSVFE